MQNFNYKSLLLKYRNNHVSDNDLNLLWECFSDNKNKDLIQNTFLDDLKSFAIVATKAHVDFETIFRNIQKKIEENDPVTLIYQTHDIRHFHFSDNLEDETLTQIVNRVNLSAPIEYALNGKAIRIFEN